MKIAITTYSKSQNYGALLQAYALSDYISLRGHECRFINNRLFDARWFRPRKTMGDIIQSVWKIQQGKKRIKRYRYFIDTYLPHTDYIATSEKLRNLNREFDAFITGSDQVWNCSGGISTVSFLNFVDINKISMAYAPSFGVPDIPIEYVETVKQFINRIKYLSIREKSGKKLIKSLTGRDALLVVDPVFLKTKEEWGKIAELGSVCHKVLKEKFLFVYSTQKSSELNRAVKCYIKKNNIHVISTHAIPGSRCEVRKDIGPLEFLRYIQTADYVISTSFHATAFSIIFEKDFCVVPHTQTGSRVVDLCEDINLTQCIWSHNSNGFEKVDYHSRGVSILKDRIEKSKKYIEESLEETNILTD